MTADPVPLHVELPEDSPLPPSAVPDPMSKEIARLTRERNALWTIAIALQALLDAAIQSGSVPASALPSEAERKVAKARRTLEDLGINPLTGKPAKAPSKHAPKPRRST